VICVPPFGIESDAIISLKNDFKDMFLETEILER